jgi:hypothetical protein
MEAFHARKPARFRLIPVREKPTDFFATAAEGRARVEILRVEILFLAAVAPYDAHDAHDALAQRGG